ncbi:hypothetical protein F4815DRAFT_438793 [Daldinia loculata]|nr:hypothetical protein F4815DRAFT_438793 [Daldinia loculata]
MDPVSQSLGILDLPCELLFMVFEELKASCWDPDKRKMRIYKIQAIRNVRLTCQRFCSTSSHLLLDSVTVEMNLRSVQRFQDISQHPLIAPGVRSIRILLHYYNGSLVEDLSAYEIYNAGKIRGIVRNLEWEMNYHSRQYTDIFLNRTREGCRQAMKIAEAWEHPGQSDDEGLFKRMARSGHDIYRSLYEEQELLREQRRFTRHVAEGMARMSGARELEFCDPGFSYKPASNYDLMEYGKMMKMLASPSPWDDGEEFYPASPPCEIVFDLPLTLREIGVQLTSLRIDVSLHRPEIDVPSQEHSANLTAAMQSLRRFKYVYGELCHGQPIYHYTFAVLDNSSIEEIHLNRFPNPSECVFEHMIPQRDYPSLKKMRLESCLFHPRCLSRFLNGCNPAVFKHLDLHLIELLDGTWAETLGILKGSCLDYFSIGCYMGGERLILGDELWLVKWDDDCPIQFWRQLNIHHVAREISSHD